MKYGERLRYARKDRGLSQNQLAEKSEVKQGSISKIERGDQEASTFDIALARALNISPAWLSSEEGKMESSDTKIDMDKLILRVENLKLLIVKYGNNQAKLAAALNETPGYISQLKLGTRQITEETARKMEKELSLPADWMDREHTGMPIDSAHETEGKTPDQYLMPEELKVLFVAYNEGGAAKQKALELMANLPEDEMATMLLVLQSISSKYYK
ncbi:helix-turn-helix transcriptional regulator [Candidatus Vondammii sp. HM_W22]|uniref:helix-turn-helix transcriptional regulator n=1 Tax=Candidatus Vondammii sp. HM_W22 TaxID=2687299 RepID=UPI002E7B2D92|nr:helix-turn-helix transcriptional regulator [Candidatus Vondammii sp. HM_W22]